jgi:hypothetical protein
MVLFPEYKFNVTGKPGSSWSVFASTNLVNWTNAETGTNTLVLDSTGNNSFVDSNPFGASNIFYFLSNGCCSKVIGFTAITTTAGTNLIADPLYQVDDAALINTDNGSNPGDPGWQPMNTVGALFSGDNRIDWIPTLPVGIEVIGWNGQGFITNNGEGQRLFVPNGDISLLPGNGAILNMKANDGVPIWFFGLVRQLATNQIVPGTNFLGSALPIAGGISTVLGYTNATAGDWLRKWDPTNGVFITYTNNGGTNWYRGGTRNEPYIGLDEGFVLWSGTNHSWVQKLSTPCESN